MQEGGLWPSGGVLALGLTAAVFRWPPSCWSLEELTPSRCREASVQRWLTAQDTTRFSCHMLVALCLVAHHCGDSMLPSLLPSFLPLAATLYSLSQPNYSPTKCTFIKLLCQAVSSITGKMSPFGSGAHPWSSQLWPGKYDHMIQGLQIKEFQRRGHEGHLEASQKGTELTGRCFACLPGVSGEGILLTLLSRRSLSVFSARRSYRGNHLDFIWL